MAFTIHDQAAQNQLTFPLGLLSGEAGTPMECKCWNRSGGQTQWTKSFQKHPKPTPSRPHWSLNPPGQTPSPFCWGSEPKEWTWPWLTVSAHRHHQHALKGIRPTQLTSRCVAITCTQSKRGQNETVISKVIFLNYNTTPLITKGIISPKEKSYTEILSCWTVYTPQKLSEINYTFQHINIKSLTSHPNPLLLIGGLEQPLPNFSALVNITSISIGKTWYWILFFFLRVILKYTIQLDVFKYIIIILT